MKRKVGDYNGSAIHRHNQLRNRQRWLGLVLDWNYSRAVGRGKRHAEMKPGCPLSAKANALKRLFIRIGFRWRLCENVLPMYTA